MNVPQIVRSISIQNQEYLDFEGAFEQFSRTTVIDPSSIYEETLKIFDQ